MNSAGGTITSPSNGGTAWLSGTFSGTGGLTFNGIGTTVMSGNNSYSGGSIVSSGTLQTFGNSALGSGPVTVQSGGTLSATGYLGNPITVNGKLHPGASPGYLAVGSTVTLNNGSTYLQDIAGTAQASAASPVGATGYYSYMYITGGQFVINPGATLTPRLSNLFTPNETGYGSTPYAPQLGDRFRIATADGGIVGRFTNLTQPADMTAGSQFIVFYNLYNSNSLDLAVIPQSYVTQFEGQTRNVRSVAGALDHLVQTNQSGSNSIRQDQLLYYVAGQTGSSLPGYSKTLAGEIYADTLAVVPQTTLRIQQAVASRLTDTVQMPMIGNPGTSPAMNTSGPIATGDLYNNPATSANTNTRGNANAQNSQTSPQTSNSLDTARNPNQTGTVWGEIAYQRGTRGNDSSASGYSSNLYQLVFGTDLIAGHGIKAGGGFALSQTSVSNTTGNGTVQQGTMFVYGKLPVQELVIDSMASFGLNTTDNQRIDPTYVSLGGFKPAGVTGNDALISVGLSRPFDANMAIVTPYIRAMWKHLYQTSINEGTTSVAALNVNNFDGNGYRAMGGLTIGSKVVNPLDTDFTYRFNLAGGMDSSNLLNPTLNASLGGYSTQIATTQAGNGFVQVGLYGTGKLMDNTFAYAGIGGEFRSGMTLGNANAGLRMEF